MAHWERVCSAADLPPGSRKVVAAGGSKVLVLNADGRLFAAANACPHLGVSLERAERQGCVLRCSEHGYRMELDTGRCLTEAGLRLPTFPIEERDGWLFIEMFNEPLAGPAPENAIGRRLAPDPQKLRSPNGPT